MIVAAHTEIPFSLDVMVKIANHHVQEDAGLVVHFKLKKIIGRMQNTTVDLILLVRVVNCKIMIGRKPSVAVEFLAKNKND